MSVDWSALTFWFNVVVLLINIGIAIIQWISRKHSARKDQLEQIRDDLTNQLAAAREEHLELKNRVTAVEKDVDYAPTQNDIKHLTDELHKVNSTLEKLSGEFGGVQRAVDLMNRYLLNGPEGT